MNILKIMCHKEVITNATNLKVLTSDKMDEIREEVAGDIENIYQQVSTSYSIRKFHW